MTLDRRGGRFGSVARDGRCPLPPPILPGGDLEVGYDGGVVALGVFLVRGEGERLVVEQLIVDLGCPVVALLAGLMAAVFALIVATFASNKVEGLALTKGLSVFMLG